jgi:hypothetical protein
MPFGVQFMTNKEDEVTLLKISEELINNYSSKNVDRKI